METTTSHPLLSPPLSTLDTFSSSESSPFLKMEDLHTSSASSPAPSAFDTATLSQASPPPVIITSKPAKKRKSWGQQLPEPKTALPPRKRAKTDDEKEQRRIERIKRNRAAAHNSRERKRQETETLAVALAKANAQLDAYRKLYGQLPDSVILPEVTICTEDPDTPAPSLSETRDTGDESASAPSPATPVDSILPDFSHIKEEPLDSTHDTFLHPDYLDNLDMKPSNLGSSFMPLDLTQHSAAMLCDLPCRSSSMKRSSPHPNRFRPATSSHRTPATWWSTLILYLTTHQIRLYYKTILLALWMISPSRMVRMMQASAIRSSRLSNSSTTRCMSRSTPRRLALPSAATGRGAPRLSRPRSLEESATATERDGARQASVRSCVRDEVLSIEQGLEEVRSMNDAGNEKDGV